MADAFRQVEPRGYQTTIDLAQKHSYNNDFALKRGYDVFLEDAIVSKPQDLQGNTIHKNEILTLPPQRLQASRMTRSVTTDVEVEQHPSEYTQRKSRASTPGATQNPLLSLAHPKYGLPARLISNFAALGVPAIYPWQSACLLGRRLLTGKQNLVYTAPTGGGKSLIADVLMLKKVIENPGKKAILVLPYVALVQEKMKWLRKVVEGVEKRTAMLTSQAPSWQLRPTCIRSAGFFGGSHAKATWADIDIAVCTIEKANALVNTAIEEGKIDQLGIVVLDELHMLDEENRGYLIELMITKLLSLQHGIQLVGMSATLSNPQLMADWLDAKFYVSKYRPIPIEEHLVYDNAIYPTANVKEFFRTAGQLTGEKATQRPLVAQRTIQRSIHHELDNPLINAVVALAVDTAIGGFGALVFCGSRQGTQTTATLISNSMPSNSVCRDTLEQRGDVLASLQALPGGFEATLAKTVAAGVGFHHAGLTVEERDIVAGAFDQGVIKVIVATCSLAAGINLPARRVILHGARMGRDLIGPAMLRQMRGRAGRKGKDEVGETYLVCQKSDLEAVADLLEAELPPVESCLTPEKRGVKRALLEVVVTRLGNSRDALDEYIQRSLLWRTTEHDQVQRMVGTAIEDLLKTQLIEVTPEGVLEPTQLGQAVVASSLAPDDGIFVHTEMRRALESFVMDGEMHIFYLFTPVHTAADISWPIFRDELERLDESGIRALRCVGISPNLVNKLVHSGAELKESTPEEANMVRMYRRAYCAFQLRDLCNEVPIHNISLKFAVPRGSVQNLAQTCHGFAAGMIKFCQRMGWGMLAAVLDHMVDRLRAGARADLLEMAQVTYVQSRMARILWENGWKSVRALAEADTKDVVPIMMQAQQPRKLKLSGGAAEKLRQKLQEKAEVMVSSANRLWEKQQRIEFEE